MGQPLVNCLNIFDGQPSDKEDDPVQYLFLIQILCMNQPRAIASFFASGQGHLNLQASVWYDSFFGTHFIKGLTLPDLGKPRFEMCCFFWQWEWSNIILGASTSSWGPFGHPWLRPSGAQAVWPTHWCIRPCACQLLEKYFWPCFRNTTSVFLWHAQRRNCVF